MSYILDALRRADAERERGVVPGLQSQQHTIADDDAAPPARSPALVWAVGGLSVALVAALAWNVFGGRSATPRPVSEGAVAPAPAAVPTAALPTATAPAVAPTEPSTPPPPTTSALATPTAPPPTSTSAAPPTKSALAPSQTGAVEPSPAGADGGRNAAPSRAAARRVAEARRSTPARDASAGPTSPGARSAAEMNAESAAGPARGPATGATTAATANNGAARSADARIYQPSELPEDVRRDLPKLAIGGSSYSGDAASRMVMINGQVFHEGDQLAPGLVLDRIKLKSAVLSYKGYRYEMTF